MSGKIKKTSEDVSFSLSRWFRKVSSNAPVAAIITIIGIAYTVFLLGGGLYTLINRPIPVYPTSTGFLFLYPDISSQFGADTFISIALYLLGFMGMYSIYRSAKNAHNPRQAYILLVIGVTFLLISYIFLEGAIKYKGG